MIKISKSGNSILVEGLDNVFYPDNGKLTFPSNSLILTIDDSNMATFKSAANNDVMFSGLIENIRISGETVTKDDIISKFGIVAYSSGGGGGTGAVDSVNGQTGDVVITAASLGAITKVDADKEYATKTELEEKQEVFQVNAPMSFNRDEATQDLHLSINLDNYATKSELPDVSDMETKTNAAATYQVKGDYALKSEIPDVSNLATKAEVSALSAEVEHKADKATTYTTTEVDEKLGKKQDTLVSGTNIKTINGESVLGSGDIVISGGGSTDWNDITNKPTIPSAQGGSSGTNAQYIYSSKDSLNYRSIASQRLAQKGGYTSMEYWYWGQSEEEATIMDFPYATSSNGGSMSPSDKSKLDAIPSIQVLTQDEYNALPSKDANTLYFIKE